MTAILSSARWWRLGLVPSKCCTCATCCRFTHSAAWASWREGSAIYDRPNGPVVSLTPERQGSERGSGERPSNGSGRGGNCLGPQTVGLRWRTRRCWERQGCELGSGERPSHPTAAGGSGEGVSHPTAHGGRGEGVPHPKGAIPASDACIRGKVLDGLRPVLFSTLAATWLAMPSKCATCRAFADLPIPQPGQVGGEGVPFTTGRMGLSFLSLQSARAVISALGRECLPLEF